MKREYLGAIRVSGGAGWRDADHYAPELQSHTPQGQRIDAIRFHPAYHESMRIARHNGIANLPYVDGRPLADPPHARIRASDRRFCLHHMLAHLLRSEQTARRHHHTYGG